METERIRSTPVPADPPPAETDRRRARPRQPAPEAPVIDISPVEATANPAATSRSAQVWLPTIPPRRRLMLLELHRHIATTLSHDLRDRLRPGDHFSFEGIALTPVRELGAQEKPGAITGLFAIEEQRINGLVLADAALAAYFARVPYGPSAGAENQDKENALTRLEMVIAGRALDDLVGHLAASYADAGLGSLQRTGRGEALTNNPRFNPDDYMVVFRFRVGTAEAGMDLTIAAGVDLINLCRAPVAAFRPSITSPAMKRAAAIVPVDAAIILGGWRVTLEELARLRPGDEIVLPDGDNAWLTSGGIHLRRILVEFADGRFRASPRRTIDGAS